MVKILREADKSPVSEVAKKHGVSDVTIYAWRKRFGQLEAVDVKRLRQQLAQLVQDKRRDRVRQPLDRAKGLHDRHHDVALEPAGRDNGCYTCFD